MSADYGFVLLAAGKSSRLGRPKALLQYGSSTLIGHAIRQMTFFNVPIIVVSGAQPLALQDVTMVHNPDWAQGIASSIRFGLSALMPLPGINAALFAVCDQPGLHINHLKTMLSKRKNYPNAIIASAYGATWGTPVLFGKRYFPDLLTLTGDQGAKTLLRTYSSHVVAIDFPEGECDIGTEEDYATLINSHGLAQQT